MELAVNLFNKGLLIDSHPMVLSNDTLTDALNATFVTMNGNEVVLQNDMGNRKIDHANLPSGYEPVGMKEYGGIIYVAAYNPLTNRGQIGSFPSPQRKLSINNSEYNLLLTDFLDIKNKSISIKVDNITVPISGDLILHTGDKFSIYSEEIGNIILYLVPLKQNGILKNNLFSFQVGIFNSQNEFIDISNKLINLEIIVVKQENNENINYTYNYYITENSRINLNLQSQNTLSDLKLLEARNSLAINTYSYKMSSPLYLRMKLNHVNNITYTIDGDIIKESEGTKDVNLYISVTFHYNCIDKIDKNYFKLLFNGDEYSSLEEKPENNLEFNPIYSEELDEYQVTLNYLVKVEDINSSEFNYILEFPLLNDFGLFTFKNADNNIIPIIQNNLTLENSINIGLLGSDSVIFSGYRYLFNESSKQITLELDIESYPKKKGSSNYKIAPTIYYYNKDNEEIKYLLPFIEGENGKSPVSGVYTMTFNYELLGLEERKLYHIKLLKTYDEQNYLNLENNNSGIIITTSIFNGNYIGSKPFKEGVTLNGGKYDYEIAKDDYIDNFLKIQELILTPIINVTYDLYSSGISLKEEGQLICELSESEPTSYYSIKEDYNMVTKIYPSASLKNIELLPKELESKISLENTAISVIGRTVDNNLITKSNNVNGNVHFEGSYIYSQNLVEFRGEIEETKVPIVIEMDEDVLNNEITTHVIVHNFIDGKLVEKPILCRRVITSLYDFLIKSIFDNSKKYYHISEPYATLDFEDTSTKLGVRMDSGPITDHTGADDDERKIFTSLKYPQDAINDTFRQYTENLFILEYSTNDRLVGFPPVYESFGWYNKDSGIKRIWMRISEKEYTPIFARSVLFTDEELSTKIFDDDLDQGKFKKILLNIPHYYSYSEDSKTINRKIIDYHNLAVSKEFDVSSFMNVRVLGNITLDNTINYCTLKERKNINTELSIKEKNIKSNGLILDKLNILSSLELDCILEDSDKNIYYTDRDGNIFDPQYVYYIYNEYLSPKTFKKSYKANKFYVTDLKCEFPELKDSSLLYHKSNGEPHPYVNPKVCGNWPIVRSTVGWSWITLLDSSKKDLFGRDFSTLDDDKLIIKKDDTALFDHSTYFIPAFLALKDDNTVYWDPEITMALYEPGESLFSYARYTAKNIFSQHFIRECNLYREDYNMPDRWIDADSPQ